MMKKATEKRFILFLGLSVLLALLFLLPTKEWTGSFLDWVTTLNPAVGLTVFTLVYVAITVLFLPGVILTIGSGFIFGLVTGTMVSWIGGSLGAAISFILGRKVFTGLVIKLTENYVMFKALDRALSLNSWKLVFLLRLSPITPFNVLNYSLSLTSVRFWDYLGASTIGMLPSTVLFVYVGTAAKNLSDILNDTGDKNPAHNFMIWIGLGITLISVVSITLISMRTIKQELHEGERKLDVGQLPL